MDILSSMERRLSLANASFSVSPSRSIMIPLVLSIVLRAARASWASASSFRRRAISRVWFKTISIAAERQMSQEGGLWRNEVAGRLRLKGVVQTRKTRHVAV